MSLSSASFSELNALFDPSRADSGEGLITSTKPSLSTEDQAKVIRRRRIEGVGIAALTLLVAALICGGIYLYKSHAAPLSLIGAAQAAGLTAADAKTLYITAIACGGTAAAASVGLIINRYRTHELEDGKSVDLP